MRHRAVAARADLPREAPCLGKIESRNQLFALRPLKLLWSYYDICRADATGRFAAARTVTVGKSKKRRRNLVTHRFAEATASESLLRHNSPPIPLQNFSSCLNFHQRTHTAAGEGSVRFHARFRTGNFHEGEIAAAHSIVTEAHSQANALAVSWALRVNPGVLRIRDEHQVGWAYVSHNKPLVSTADRMVLHLLRFKSLPALHLEKFFPGIAFNENCTGGASL